MYPQRRSCASVVRLHTAATTLTDEERAEVRRLGDGLADDAGMSIIEVLVALSVLLVVMVSTAATLVQALDLSTSSHRRVIASNLASQELDRLRSVPFTQLEGWVASPPSDTVEEVEGQDFTVSRLLTWATLDVDSRSCDAPDNDGGPTHIQATVEVAWEPDSARGPVSTQTIIAPAVGEVDPTLGHLGVAVVDRGEPVEPVAGKRVQIQHQTSSEIEWTDTDEFGCAFFAFVRPGEWEVTIVETQPELWRSRPELPYLVDVGGGELQKLRVEYDRVGTLVLRVDAEDGTARPVPDGSSVTTEHTNPTTRQRHPWVAAGSPQHGEVNVFGGTDYSAWLGESIALGSDCVPEAARSETVWLDPAGDLELGVPAAALNVRTLGAAESGPQNGVTVTARRPAGMCEGEELVLDLGVSATYGEGSDAQEGWVLVAMPFGEWEITGAAGNPTTTVSVDLVPGEEPLVTSVEIVRTPGG